MSRSLTTAVVISLVTLSLSGTMGRARADQPAAAAVNPSTGVFTVKNPWIKLGKKDASTLEADATLINSGQNPVQIVGISSPGFRMGILENVIVQDGLPRDAMTSSLTIPPGQTVKLDSGHDHFALIGPRTTYKEGDHVKVKLQFQERDPIVVVFTVSAKAPSKTHKKMRKR